MKKRLLVILLCAAMVVMLLPSYAFADEFPADAAAEEFEIIDADNAGEEAEVFLPEEDSSEEFYIEEPEKIPDFAVEQEDTDEAVVIAAAADDDVASGTYDSVPWRITAGGELCIGEDGGTYTFDFRETRTDDAYPWNSYKYRSQIKSCRFYGTVNGNGSHHGMFNGFNSMTEIDLAHLIQRM